jgi:hypothetical protein
LNTARQGWGEAGRFAGLVALLALTPAIAVFAHRGVAPLVMALGVVAAFRADLWREVAFRARRVSLVDPLMLAALAYVVFCTWALAASLWSPASGALRLATHPTTPALAACALLWAISRMDERRASRLALVFASAIIAALALLSVEAASGGLLRSIAPPVDETPLRHKDMTALARGLTAIIPSLFAAAAIAAALLLGRGRRRGAIALAILLFALALCTAICFDIEANVFALIAGGVAASAALLAPIATLRSLLIVFFVFLFGSPFFVLAPVEAAITTLSDALPASWLYRLAAWQVAAGAAIDCFPLGCGPGYGRIMAESGAVVFVPGVDIPLPAIPTHPHSVFLQIWLELGVPGVLLISLAAIGATGALTRAGHSRTALAAASAAIAAFLVSAAVEASLWQVWRLAALTLAAMGVALANRIGQDDVRHSAAPGTAPAE